MQITRLDLDGIGSPRGLARRIHEVEDLPIAVPIEDLCDALDITTIQEVDATSFEAALITDDLRSAGHILVNRNSPRLRRRFSIAHELGHFLIEAHQPREGNGIHCALGDLHQIDPKSKDRHRRMEGQANTFAASLLMPPKRIREKVGDLGVSLETVVSIARDFEVSKEAMARAFVASHGEPVAVIVSRNGRVERFYRHEDFPFLPLAAGKPLAPEALAIEPPAPGVVSQMEDVEPENWLTERDVERTLALTEQVLGQVQGHALTLLQAELDDEI